MIKAVIVAGGRGRRLRPLTDTLPKPLLKVGGSTLLEHNINLLKKYGINNFIVTVSYHPEDFPKKYDLFFEKKPLGTAGAIAKLGLTNTFIVCYGDVLREINITDLLQYHKKKSCIGTICVYRNVKRNPKSSVKFNKDGLITSFAERPKKPTQPVWSNASFYILEPEIVNYIRKDKIQDFGKDVFPGVVKTGKKLYAYEQKGYFLDVGNLSKLEKARKDVVNF